MALEFSFGNPVNTALLLYIIYTVQRILLPSVPKPSASSVPNEFKGGYSWLPPRHPPTVRFEIYTPKTLTKYDGKDGGRILLAIRGHVFDVTQGRNFYGPSECSS
jgi:membrane-associated progesterone receptor component